MVSGEGFKPTYPHTMITGVAWTVNLGYSRRALSGYMMVAMGSKQTQQHNRLITFKGGPLDGQTKIKTSPGRWPAYLLEDGETLLPTATGDRIMSRGRSSGFTGCYRDTQTPDLSTMPVTINHVYVHSSIPRGQDHS